MLSLFFWAAIFQAPPTHFNITDVAAYYVFQNYHSIAEGTMAKMFGNKNPPNFNLLGKGSAIIGFGQILVMYLIILASLAGLFAIARLWLRWKENF
jgi:hypothetical protein